MFNINPESLQEEVPVTESLPSPAEEESVRERTRAVKAKLDALTKNKGKAGHSMANDKPQQILNRTPQASSSQRQGKFVIYSYLILYLLLFLYL